MAGAKGEGDFTWNAFNLWPGLREKGASCGMLFVCDRGYLGRGPLVCDCGYGKGFFSLWLELMKKGGL